MTSSLSLLPKRRVNGVFRDALLLFSSVWSIQSEVPDRPVLQQSTTGERATRFLVSAIRLFHASFPEDESAAGNDYGILPCKIGGDTMNTTSGLRFSVVLRNSARLRSRSPEVRFVLAEEGRWRRAKTHTEDYRLC